MVSRPADQEFLKFRTEGCPEALGRVFEALAPGLLGVATQLASPGDAEDLVQAAFLSAIERSASWDSDRPLRPWLIGILVNEAKVLRRRQRRKVDPDRVEVPELPGPDEAAELQELAERATDAIDGLPDSFRQVCLLRLVHGLEPVQIGRVLGIPTATVRTRLHRALARLRGELPVAMAVGLAAALEAGSLTAARAAVLDAAERYVPAPAPAPAPVAAAANSGAWLSGYAVMNKKLSLVLVGIVVLVAGSFAWKAGEDEQRAAPESGRAVAVADGVPLVEPLTESSEEFAPPVRAAVARPADVAGTRFHGIVRGRAGEPGAPGESMPLPGVRVRVEAAVGLENEVALLLGSATTDALGRFEFRSSALSALGPLVTAGAWIRARADLEGWEPASKLVLGDLVEIEMARIRGEVCGRLVGADGRPIAHVPVFLSRAGAEPLELDGVSDSDGRFRIFYSEPADYALTARAAQHGLMARSLDALQPDGVHDLGDLELSTTREMGAVSARFLLGDRSPVHGVSCWLRHADTDDHRGYHESDVPLDLRDGRPVPPPAALAETDEDGRIYVTGLQPGDYVATLESAGPDQEFRVRADGLEQEVLVDGQLITVRMVGRHGELLPNADISGSGWFEPGTDTGVSGGPGRPEADSRFASRCAAGFCRILSPAHAAWLFVGMRTGGAVPSEIEHVVRPGVFRADLSLRTYLPRAEDMGSLALEVFGANGVPLEPLRVHWRLPVSAKSLHAAEAILAPGERVVMPAGEWAVVVDAGPCIANIPFVPRLERTVVVHAGQNSSLRLVADPQRSFLRVALAVPDRVGDAVIESLIVRTPDGEFDFTGRYRAAEAEPDQSFVSFYPQVDLREPFLVPPIGPGQGEVVLRVRGCTTARQAFSVRAGQVADMRFELDPR